MIVWDKKGLNNKIILFLCIKGDVCNLKLKKKMIIWEKRFLDNSMVIGKNIFNL